MLKVNCTNPGEAFEKRKLLKRLQFFHCRTGRGKISAFLRVFTTALSKRYSTSHYEKFQETVVFSNKIKNTKVNWDLKQICPAFCLKFFGGNPKTAFKTPKKIFLGKTFQFDNIIMTSISSDSQLDSSKFRRKFLRQGCKNCFVCF